MDTDLITNIAINQLMSELCLKWHLEPNEIKKQEIYGNEILPLYKKINNLIN